ncbi:MAG TPA: TolC family protein [Flavobacteriales bacterium]|nr:TolC family protein [Flavobacteriales bacterium]
MKGLMNFLPISFFLLPSTAVAQVYSLTQCIEQAWTHHPQIKILEQGNNISLEQLEQLKATAQPSLAFNAAQNMNSGRSIDPFTYQFTNETIFSNSFSLSASVTLFSGFKFARSKEQQALMIEANKENIAKIKNDLALSIANQYLQVILYKQQISALDTQMAQTQRQYDREQKLFDAGKSNQNKLLQLKAQALNEEVRKTDLILLHDNALTSLKYAAAFDTKQFDVVIPDIEPVLKSLSDYTFESVYAEAEKNMASVKYAKANELYYQKGIAINRAGYYPALTMSGSLSSGYSSARKQNTFNTQILDQPLGYLYSNPTEVVYGPVVINSLVQSDYPFGRQVGDNFSQFLGLNLRVPILTNRNNKTSVQIAQISYDRSKTETENTLLGLKKDIETAMNSYTVSNVKMQKHVEIVELQKTILKNLETYYNAGNLTLFELISQKNTVQQANASFLQSQYELVFRKLVLDYYSGKPLVL